MGNSNIRELTTEELVDKLMATSNIVSKVDGCQDYGDVINTLIERHRKMRSALKPILKCRFDKSKFTGNYIMTHGNAFDAIMEAQKIMKGLE